MKWRNVALLVLLALLWGPSFLFIKVGVSEIPPITFVFSRVSVAAFILYIILRARGQYLPRSLTVWKHLAFVGLIHNALPFVLFGWGEQYVDSALASIVNGMTPIFTILMAHLVTQSDRLTWTKGIGAALSLSGLAFLIGPTLVGGFQATTWGLLAMTAATVCYGIALVYTRKHLRDLPALVGPTGQLLMASIYLLPLSLLIDRPFSLSTFSWPALGAVLGIAFFGTAMAFLVYYELLRVAEASYVSLVTYLVPIVGVILGVVVLGEQLSWFTLAGTAVILLGVFISQRQPAPKPASLPVPTPNR